MIGLKANKIIHSKFLKSFAINTKYITISTSSKGFGSSFGYGMFDLHKFSFSKKFDLLDKEINDIKKINSENRNKSLFKNKINKQKFLGKSGIINTEEIAERIDGVKEIRENHSIKNNNIDNSFKSKAKESFPTEFENFLDEPDKPQEKLRNIGLKSGNINNEKPSSNFKIEKVSYNGVTDKSALNNNNNSSKNENKIPLSRINVMDFETEEDINKIESKLINKNLNSKAKSNIGDSEQFNKPYRGFGKHNEPRLRSELQENERESLYSHRKEDERMSNSNNNKKLSFEEKKLNAKYFIFLNYVTLYYHMISYLTIKILLL